MKNLLIFILSFFSFSTAQLYAQNRGCATHDLFLEKTQLNPKLAQEQQLFEQQIQEYLLRKQQQRTDAATTDTTFVIPVVIHIIHNISSGKITSTNISNEQIYSQIDVLNEDFGRLNADTTLTPSEFKPFASECKIQFCLASADPSGAPTTGINRVYNSRTSWGVGYSDEVTLKSLSYWPSDKYLNIWVCNLSGGVLGYAQLPGGYGLGGLDPTDQSATTDGVVIHYKAFGNTGIVVPPYHLGRTTTHEVGHWFGMRHIWGDIYAGTGDFCGDDYVNDTPWQQAPHTDVNTCIDYSLCNQSGGSYHTDMTCNYMDYSADACMNMFTGNQKERMHAVMHMSPRRKALFKSKGCCMGKTPVAIPLQEDFTPQSAYLTEDWTVINGDSAETTTEKWTTVQLANGNDVIAINNIGVFDTIIAGADIYYDYLTTPTVTLQKSEAPVLTFDLAYASNGSLETDSLVVSFTFHCDTIWHPLLTLYGTDLLTTTRTTSSFIPGDQEWKNFSVDLSAMSNLTYASFRFEDYSKQINTVYLDNINLHSNPAGLDMTVYPVPSDGLFTVDLYYANKRDLQWMIYNELGQIVYNLTETQVFSHSNQLDLRSFPAGIYIIKLVSDEDVVQKKVLIY